VVHIYNEDIKEENMERGLTKSELMYLESLISRIDDVEVDFTGTPIHEEIKIMKDISKRKYINTDVGLDGILKNSYDSEADLINSWKEWYINTTSLKKKHGT